MEDAKPNISSLDYFCKDDIILSIDGKRVASTHQAQKFVKAATFQFTVRVERKVRGKIIEENCNESSENVPTLQLPAFNLLRKRKTSESDSSSSSTTTSLSGSPFKKKSFVFLTISNLNHLIFFRFTSL